MPKEFKRIIRFIGPGVVTGASDDDPAGIAIYSQAGAQAGYSLLWSSPFLIPFMIAVQEMAARIGMVTGRGLIGAMRKLYPKSLLWVIAASVFVANTVNIGADLAAMATSTQLLVGANLQIIALLYAAVILLLLIFFSYKTITRTLKWLTLSLFAYVLATFSVQQDWTAILRSTFIPHIELNRETILLFVAIIGTTISPYLFFWQASDEAENRYTQGQVDRRRKIQVVPKMELKAMAQDVSLGMFFSNLVMYFIMATAASTLFRAGIHQIDTAAQAAAALRPLAGDSSFLLFTLGVVGTGFLAIPVLAGSAAYAVSEFFGLEESFETRFSKSRVFYIVVLLSTLLGLGFTLFNIPPFRALFLTGVLYGLLSPILILIILGLANRKEVMGEAVNTRLSNFFGVTTFVVMALAALGALIL